MALQSRSPVIVCSKLITSVWRCIAPRSDQTELEKLEKLRNNLKVARHFLKGGFFLRSLSADTGLLFLSQGREAFVFYQERCFFQESVIS